ncbi:MAG: ATP-binding cassette domain-containing protein [Streptosporangiales bacterium]|nr:ATP-binding cassette domain-containing protein [Streptosporangiales bacterium]
MTRQLVLVDEFSALHGNEPIVDRVSFRMDAGSVTALVGESGSGKTTTGLALLGEVAPGIRVSGRVLVDGHPVDAEHPPPPGLVGYVPQHPSTALNPARKVGGVLAEIARLHIGSTPVRRRRTGVRRMMIDAMRRAEIADPAQLLDRYPHQLSGGQQQRVVLAQALIGKAKLIVADEPTTGQDALTRQRVAGELRAMRERGIAVLLLTHDLDLVELLADQVLVMRGGELLERGKASQVLHTPAHDYTRALTTAHQAAATARELTATRGDLLVVEGLTAGHRRARASRHTLHDVSIRISAGERVALVGRSGSGKTTLARCIAGLHTPFEGRMLLDGSPLAPGLRHRSRADLAAVQYVFQDSHASFSEFTAVIDQVARTAVRLFGTPVATARRDARTMLERFGLSPAMIDRRPTALSGGELQRAALARALLAEPRVLICDEITSGLDVITQAALLRQLRDHHRDLNRALVLVTHDLAVVTEIADRMLVMDDGRIIEDGPADQVLARPAHELTRALVESSSVRRRAAIRR